VTLLAVATLVGALNLAQPQTAAAEQSADVDSRLRVVSARVAEVIRSAGGGLSAGPRPGALAWWVPVVFPQRRSVPGADGELTAFDNRVTVFRAAAGGGSTTLAIPMASPASPLQLVLGGGCALGRAACGLAPGDRALIADAGGQFDMLLVQSVGTEAVTAYAPARLSKAYGADGAALVAAVDVDAVAFDPASRQLRWYRGSSAGMPFAEHVESLRLRYFGDPQPPRGPGGAGQASCVVDESGQPRLPALEPTDGPFVELTPQMLSDGPACGTPPHRFDADLLRVRVVRVTLRLGTGDAPAHTALGRTEPREVTFDVSIRNTPS